MWVVKDLCKQFELLPEEMETCFHGIEKKNGTAPYVAARKLEYFKDVYATARSKIVPSAVLGVSYMPQNSVASVQLCSNKTLRLLQSTARILYLIKWCCSACMFYTAGALIRVDTISWD